MKTKNNFKPLRDMNPYEFLNDKEAQKRAMFFAKLLEEFCTEK